MTLNSILEAMHRGATLHLTLADQPTWKLNNGVTEITVSTTTVRGLLKRGVIAPNGDSLFPDLPAQTWHYVGPKEP
jgi:hypothetical protein